MNHFADIVDQAIIIMTMLLLGLISLLVKNSTHTHTRIHCAQQHSGYCSLRTPSNGLTIRETILLWWRGCVF